MAIYVSFFKPEGMFEGSFNHLVSWWTGGDYCHCEIVFKMTPGHVIQLLKKVHDGQDEATQKRLVPELEKQFYENSEFKHLAQNKSTILMSFSLLWGDKIRIRFVTDEHTLDPWKQLNNKHITLLEYKCHHFDNMCLFALRNLGKPYATSSALTAWMPTFGLRDNQHRNAYFCSEFVADVMKQDKPIACASFRTTPNRLYQLLTNQEDTRVVDETFEPSARK